jgi:hypothetical protein
MRYLLVIAILGALVGCARHVTVNMPKQSVQNGISLAKVKVNDLRTPGIAASKREAAFGVPMGNITFSPTESEIIKKFLEVELTKILKQRGIQSQQHYVCDILKFGVNTNTTPLYWDVVGNIQLVLKYGSKQYNLSGNYTERTYVWPGESIMMKVIDESLKQISDELYQAL